MLFYIGKEQQDSRSRTYDFFIWLFNYLFLDTIMLVSHDKIVFAAAQRKIALLSEGEVPESYTGPKVEFIVKTQEDSYEAICKQVVEHTSGKGTMLGFTTDEDDKTVFNAGVTAALGAFPDIK